ncbi:MarR family winged helix-turn-helix transcriptional regulator [Vibrio mediterranei]
MQKKFKILSKKAAQKGIDVDSIEFCGNLFAAQSQLEQTCYKRLEDFDLLEGRFVCMLLINNAKKISPHELATEIGLARASITAIADSLENKGYIVRKPSPHDRRSILLEMTDEGKAILEDVTKSQLEWLESRFAQFSKDEKDMANAILKKLCANTFT